MKITEVTLDRLRLPLSPPLHAAWDPAPRRWFDATIVRVHTDEGVTGIGSGDTMDGFDAVRHLFVGQDPLDIARHVQAIETANFHGGRFWPLEAALWDVIGKVAGLPVATLFGNSARALPAYASSAETKEPAERVEVTRQAQAAGFRAVKIRIDRDRADTGLATVAAVREALGPDFGIMVDLNQSWRMAGDVAPATDLAATRRIVRRLAELDLVWVEEPLPYPTSTGSGRCAPRTRGSGSRPARCTNSVPQLLAYLEQDVLDVYQMDVVLAIGMAGRGPSPSWPRSNTARSPRTAGPTASACWRTCTSARESAAVRGSRSRGIHAGWTPQRRDFMLAEPLVVSPAGELEVPQRPGLGVVLDEDAVDRWRR